MLSLQLPLCDFDRVDNIVFRERFDEKASDEPSVLDAFVLDELHGTEHGIGADLVFHDVSVSKLDGDFEGDNGFSGAHCISSTATTMSRYPASMNSNSTSSGLM